MFFKEQSGLNNPWKFAAGYLDSSTSLYKFGTRYYDPTLGRRTQQDPVGGSLGDLNSANRYVYAGDDPVNAVDPSGKFTFYCDLVIFFTLFGFGYSVSWVFTPAAATVIYGIAEGVASLTGIGLVVGIILFTVFIAAIGIGYALGFQLGVASIQQYCY